MHKWLILLSMVAGLGNAEPAYTWVDENGVVHYSDRPAPGARTIELPGTRATSAAPRPPSAPQPTPQQAPAAAQQSYERVAVVSPTHLETLWNIGGNLNVQLELSPGLQPGHTLAVHLDGQLTEVGGTQFTLTEVWRGVHTLQAVVLDGNGREVASSDIVTFTVQQTSLLNPNNPNPPPRAPPQPGRG